MTPPEEPSGPDQERPPDSPAAFPCAYCGADTRAGLVKAAFWGREGLVAIEDIPARVCEGCGEPFYDDETAQRIEGIVNGSTAVPRQRISVPVFSLAGAENTKRGADATTPR